MTSLLTVKLRRDLRASWSRFLLMVIAIAISLTAFGAVLFAWAASGRETSSAYLGTEPASATIVLDRAIDAEQMATIAAEARRRPGVIDATGRTQFTGDVEVNGQPREIPLQVFVAAPDDPMQMANFDVQQGSWPPSPHAGDTVQLIVGGEPTTWRVVGLAEERGAVVACTPRPRVSPTPWASHSGSTSCASPPTVTTSRPAKRSPTRSARTSPTRGSR